MTTPVPIALIGLSASAATSWAASAHLPALLSPRGKQLFRIAALLNSSTEAATAAAKHFNLTPTPRAYGSPAALAADPEVKAVLCAVRVDNHLSTTLPAIQAGKDAYIEWPIGANVSEAETLLAAAQKSGARVAIGLQGRWTPPFSAVKRALASGGLGRVLSAELRAYGGTVDRGSVPEKLAYFLDKKIGGNAMTIGFGHAVDAFQYAVGEIGSDAVALPQIQRPSINIVAGPERKIVRQVGSDVPDLLRVQGTLSASDGVAPGASASASFRIGQPPLDEPPLVWIVACEHGEVRLEARGGASLQASGYDPAPVVKVRDYASGEVREDSWAWSAGQAALPIPARCVYACLEAFAVGDESKYTSLESAVARARQIDGWIG